LSQVVNTYWPKREKSTSFNGRLDKISEISILEILKRMLKWKERDDVKKLYIPQTPSLKIHYNQDLEKGTVK
jgi:hypothetical protein